MAENVNINLRVKSELDKLKGFRDSAAEKGAFKGPGGAEALNRIDGLFDFIKKLNKEGVENDWKEVVSSIKTIYSELSQFSSKVSKLSPVLENIYKDLNKKEQELSTLSNKKVSAIQGRSEVGQKIKSITESENISFHKLTKKGNVDKNILTNPETILKNYKENTLALRDKDGNEIRDKETINKHLQSLSAEYDKYTTEINNITREIVELSNSVDVLNQKIKQQSSLEKSSGENTNSQLFADVEYAKHSFNKESDKITEDLALQKEAKITKIDTSQLKAGNSAATGWSKAFQAVSLYSVAIRGLKTALNSAIKTVTELDKYLTEQAMVTGKTRSETYSLLRSYQDLATQCGATTKEIAEVSTEYLKQGKSTEEALVLTEAAVKAAKVARVSVSDSVNYLTTALNGFRLEASEAMKVSDKFAAIAAASATDYDELAIALSKVASQANLAGMSIDYTTALLTKGLETTREAPETMGTALKTIIARMRELGDYGETLDDGMEINKVESQLAYVDIALRDTNGELRSTEDVLDELGKKWDSLNKNQQAAIAKALAGTRQQSRLIAMMEDYERVTELQEISQRSAGATAAQADKYLQGMEAATNNVRVAWEKVSMAFTNSEGIIKFIDLVADGLTVVGDILDTTAGQVGVFGTIAGISAVILGNKMREHSFAKETQRLEKERALQETERAIQEQETLKAKAEAKKKEIVLEHERQANAILANATDKKAAIDKNIADLKEKEAIVDKRIEKYKSNIVTAEGLKLQIEANKKEHEELITKKKQTAEMYQQLALQASESGNQADFEKYSALAKDADIDLSTEEEKYNSANYQGQIDEKNKIISNNNKILNVAEKEKSNIHNDIVNAESSAQSEKSKIDDEAKSKIEELTTASLQQIDTQKEIISNAGIQIGLYEQQKTLLESQLSPISAIASGITGWITPIKQYASEVWKLAKGFASIPGKIKNKLDLSKTLKKNTNELKKNTKEKKKAEKQSKKLTKQEKQEAKANIEAAAAETKETIANKAAVATEGAEATANTLAIGSETVETAANELAGKAETKEAAGNIKSTATETAETISSTVSSAADLKEASTSLVAAKADEKESKANTVNAYTGSAESASKIPYVGWAIALGILAMAGIAATASLLNVNGAFDNSYGADKKADNINKLSGEIYELTERAKALDGVIDSFNDIDDKVIKTKKDMEEMNSLLEQAGDELSDEIGENEDIGYGEGVSAKEAYEKLTREQDKIAFLEAEAERNRKLAEEKRKEQLDIFNNARSFEKQQLLYGTDAQYVSARSSIYATNNSALYEYIDTLKDYGGANEEALQATEEIAQAMLEELGIVEALGIANEKSNKTIQNLVNTIEKSNSAKTFLNEDETFLTRINAFKELTEEFQGNQEALNALKSAYSEWYTMMSMDESIINFIDNMGLTIDEINDLYAGYKKLQKADINITKEEYADKLDSMMMYLEDDLSNLEYLVRSNFSDVLSEASDFDEAWNVIVSSIGDSFAVTVLDMGQNMEKFKNTINSFYETSAEWGEMSESEKMEFISDNQELFAGEGGKELLAAFQSGNYEKIQQALAIQMEEETAQKLAEVRRTIAVEEARVGEDRNEAYIAALKDYEEYLDSGDNLYKASLELRLEKEEQQLEEYRSYLEEQQEALEESLEKRKEAYEKYFDAINESQEDEDYEEQANLLISNLNKLGSSTNASSVAQTKELEKQLEDLEEERLKELRERAQEAILENMDDQIEEISEKFDKLLESNQALLAAMRGDLNNPAKFISELIGTKVENGATANELEQYLGTLQTTYGSTFKDGDLEQINVREENNQLILNVNGKEVVLDTQNEQNLYSAIMKALTEIGLR